MTRIEERIAALAARRPGHADDLHSWLTFPVEPEWGLPVVRPFRGALPDRWLPFPGSACDAGTHFFVVDERFERAWRRPLLYASRLHSAHTLLSPDFSVWREMPRAMHLWQTYRNRWLGALWQRLNFRVVPTVGWAADPEPFFFAGLPRRATLAVASIGLSDRAGQLMFERGLAAMEEALDPDRLLVYGGLRYGRVSRAEVIEVPYSNWYRKWDAARHGDADRRMVEEFRAQSGEAHGR